MRDRTASRTYSPARDEFRQMHERHRAWGLAQRHAERLGRCRAAVASSGAPGRPDPQARTEPPAPKPAAAPPPVSTPSSTSASPEPSAAATPLPQSPAARPQDFASSAVSPDAPAPAPAAVPPLVADPPDGSAVSATLSDAPISAAVRSDPPAWDARPQKRCTSSAAPPAGPALPPPTSTASPQARSTSPAVPRTRRGPAVVPRLTHVGGCAATTARATAVRLPTPAPTVVPLTTFGFASMPPDHPADAWGPHPPASTAKPSDTAASPAAMWTAMPLNVAASRAKRPDREVSRPRRTGAASAWRLPGASCVRGPVGVNPTGLSRVWWCAACTRPAVCVRQTLTSWLLSIISAAMKPAAESCLAPFSTTFRTARAPPAAKPRQHPPATRRTVTPASARQRVFAARNCLRRRGAIRLLKPMELGSRRRRGWGAGGMAASPCLHAGLSGGCRSGECLGGGRLGGAQAGVDHQRVQGCHGGSGWVAWQAGCGLG